MKRTRKLYLSICDYNKNIICDLYDNQSDISGQATNVCITKERNGWKELTFDIPSSCIGENGLEENYRLNYLIAEYKIKAVTDNETDWFIISEPQITHSGFSKNVSVRAGHISQTLKNKNMDLEFSDDEGNNVGTAEQILTTILEGSGWHVGTVERFKEDNGEVKVRSISGQAGSGALSFIEQLCDVFDAKPIYHGEGQIVDIVAMNPFSEIDPERIPYELKDSSNVLELHYDRNTHDLSKTTNTDNMATRLYAYGSSGDMNGTCTLQQAEHSEYVYTVNTTASEYGFEDLGGKMHFFNGTGVQVDDVLVYSDMDLTSQLYIWNETQQQAYHLYDKPVGTYEPLENPEYEIKRNYFPYILGLQYYYNVGLMNDEQLQQVALFQRDLPVLYQTSEEAAAEYYTGEQELSRIAEHNTGLLKLKIKDRSSDDGYAKLTIDTEENKGIIFRTDYDVTERKYFQWHVAKELQENGDPVSGTPSILFVIHDTDPITWDKAYIKAIYDNELQKVVDNDGNPADFKYTTGGFPTAVTTWSKDLRWSSTDKVYLFCTNSMTGLLGARFSEDEAVIENLYNKTDKHPTQFWDADSSDPIPARQNAEYEWLYGFHRDQNTPGSLYFSWQAKGDNAWRTVYMQTSVPAVQNDAYFYNLKDKTLWHGENSAWVQCESAAEQRVADHFTKVYYYCRRRDMLYKGLYEFYTHNCVNLPAGNYAIATNFAFYWTFKTKATTESNLKLDTVHGYVIPDGDMNSTYTIETKPFETVIYPSDNDLAGKNFYPGTLKIENGVEEDSDTRVRTGTIKVYESKQYDYSLPSNSIVCFYDINLKFIANGLAVGGTGSFSTPPRARYIRISSPEQNPNSYIRLHNYNTEICINEDFYTILDSVSPSEEPNELIGINPLMAKFADLADRTYIEYYSIMTAAQEATKTRTNSLTESLSDMIKDGRWQDANYVAGDQKRLYDDAMDMLRQVSMPEIDYNFTYLDMYGVENEHFYEEHESEWPCINITDAAHLVDTETNTNCWAYIDKIQDCYDKPWETSVDVDTKLTLAARHGFTDVIARIAEVAKEINSKKSQYDQAASGKVTGSRLEGEILLTQAYLNGGSSNWYTDGRGNLIFEAADGLSAVSLGGRGLGVANSKNVDGTWAWRTATTGYGITADEITTGHLDAELITARSITADKLMSNVGQELEIGSNKALTLYATADGSRPAGSVHTSDAKIEIRAGDPDQNRPAQINVVSGGELNLTGGNINITSQGNLNVNSGGAFALSSGGANLSTTIDGGLYIGSDGLNLGGGKFKVTFSGNTSTVNITAGYFALGVPGNELTEFVVDGTKGVIRIKADNQINITSGKTLTLTSSGSVVIGNTGKPFTIGSNGTNAYIYYGPSSLTGQTDGVYLGTDGLLIRGTSGNVTNYVKATANGTVDISGKITTKEGSIGGWTIGDDYIGNNSARDTSTIGLSKQTSGIVLWAGGARTASGDSAPKFSVQADGTFRAVKGTIASWSISSEHIGNNAAKNSSTVGLANTNSGIVFWAGGAYNGTDSNAPKFSVTAAGKLTATDAEIKGTIKADTLYIGGTQANITLDNSGHINMSSIAGTFSIKLSEADFDSLGTQSSSHLYMTPTLFQFGTSSSGIVIDDTGVSVKGNKAINLDVNSNNYVHMSQTGIVMKGSRVVIIDPLSGEESPMWGRDDIVIMTAGTISGDWRNSVSSIEAHMSERNKHDWVLIRPYYNAQIVYTQPSTVDESLDLLMSKDANEAFGDEASGYEYDVTLVFDLYPNGVQASRPAVELAIWATNGSSERRLTLDRFLPSDNAVTTTGSFDAANGYDIHIPATSGTSANNKWTCNVTFTARASGSSHNLAAEGYEMHAKVYERHDGTVRPRLSFISITARCDASTTRVPCTVYYYP